MQAFVVLSSLALGAWTTLALGAPPGDSAITYQGSLLEGGQPANGTFELVFSLWDAEDGGSQVGGPIVVDDVPVSEGVFTVELDFGAGVFDNERRWLDISVDGVVLSPRQPITRSPYSIQTRGIFADDAGRVGIGTTSPVGLLHVYGGPDDRVTIRGDDVSGGVPLLHFRNTSSGDDWVIRHDGTRLHVQEEDEPNSEVLTLRNDGHVGIGVTDPQRPLHVAHAFPVIVIQDVNDAGDAQIGYLSFRDSGYLETAWLGYGLDTDSDLSVANSIGDVVLIPAGSARIAGAPLRVENSGDDATVLELATERPWEFRQEGTGATTALKLQSVGGGGGKNFVIQTGGSVVYHNLAGSQRAEITTNDVDAGFIGTFGPNGSRNVAVHSTIANRGGLWIYDENGNVRASMWSSPTGSGLGHVVADEKNFRVENPRDSSTDIVFASVEGPEAAAYCRGTSRLIDGAATIELPAYFADVAVSEGMTVQLTPRSAESKGLAVVSRSVARFSVRELLDGHGAYEFDWEVKAVRRGFEDYEVIRPKLAGPPTVRPGE